MPLGNIVTFSNDMTLDIKKDVCLANTQNKQKLINKLREKFSENGTQMLQAGCDADLWIVKTALDSAIKYITVLVGEGTNLLILLCYYASSDANAIYLKPEQRRNVRTARQGCAP